MAPGEQPTVPMPSGHQPVSRFGAEPRGASRFVDDLPETLEWTGEFGAELVLFNPFCRWLSREGHLRQRRILTYRGMRCFYDDLDCREIVEKDEPRRWTISQVDAPWLPVKDEITFDGLGRSALHVYADLRRKFGDLPLVPDIAADRPLLVVHNKYNIEWRGAPANYISLTALDEIFRRLEHAFAIVYIRHGMAGRDPGYSEDFNLGLPFGDREVLERHPGVRSFDELYRAHVSGGGSYDINTFKNVLYSRCRHFISSQGGGAHHIAFFSGSRLAIMHRKGPETEWAYRDGFYTFVSDVPPLLTVCASDDELLASLGLFVP